jgi:hypothetical protein
VGYGVPAFFFGCHITPLRLFISLALPQECLRRLPISVYGFHFSGVGFRFQHAESLHATNPSAATKVMPPLEGRLLCSRLLSSILAFRCSRVVINGTRSAMGFALFLLEQRKNTFCFIWVLDRHCFGQREGRSV